jgi:hypothetical protein
MNPDESAVRNLLRMAGLRLTDAEVAEFVKAFPFHRRMVETLYSVATATDDEPQLIFSPELAAVGGDGHDE